MPYELRYDPQWGRELVDSGYTGYFDEDTISIWTNCPRCKHQLSDIVFVEAPRTAGPTQTVVACNCQSKHDGRAEGVAGCGAYAGMEVSIVKGEVALTPTVATAEDKRWDDLAQKTATEAYSGAKALAEKWSATVATLLSILGVAALLGLFEQIIALPTGWRYVAAFLTALAVGAATYATYLAARAAQGQLTWMPKVTGKALRAREKESLRDTDEQLRLSRRWTATAIAITLVAVLATIVGQGQEEDDTARLLVVSDQLAEPACGIPSPGRAGQLTLQPDDKDAEVIAVSVAEIATVTTVAECP